MKTRKGRLIWLCVYFLMFLTLNALYFSYDFFTAEQDARMLQLMIYVFLTFILILLANGLELLTRIALYIINTFLEDSD
ncbi:hypothetical protein [Cytobacillus praedii]|uniref:hypothetical protein n=1 Tax=Cytobacillus praedii TaxID=1742358 RepID=UPI003AF77FF1